jgi:hypothetical protein
VLGGRKLLLQRSRPLHRGLRICCTPQRHIQLLLRGRLFRPSCCHLRLQPLQQALLLLLLLLLSVWGWAVSCCYLTAAQAARGPELR